MTLRNCLAASSIPAAHQRRTMIDICRGHSSNVKRRRDGDCPSAEVAVPRLVGSPKVSKRSPLALDHKPRKPLRATARRPKDASDPALSMRSSVGSARKIVLHRITRGHPRSESAKSGAHRRPPSPGRTVAHANRVWGAPGLSRADIFITWRNMRSHCVSFRAPDDRRNRRIQRNHPPAT